MRCSSSGAFPGPCDKGALALGQGSIPVCPSPSEFLLVAPYYPTKKKRGKFRASFENKINYFTKLSYYQTCNSISKIKTHSNFLLLQTEAMFGVIASK